MDGGCINSTFASGGKGMGGVRGLDTGEECEILDICVCVYGCMRWAHLRLRERVGGWGFPSVMFPMYTLCLVSLSLYRYVYIYIYVHIYIHIHIHIYTHKPPLHFPSPLSSTLLHLHKKLSLKSCTQSFIKTTNTTLKDSSITLDKPL